MFWKYTLFEAKLLLNNRKNWFIAFFLLFFFLVFFIYYSQDEPLTLAEEKREEADDMQATFFYLDYLREDVEEVAKVYDLATQQSSLINFQVYFIGMGDDSEEYINNGLELNDLRLEAHELGNTGIPNHLVVPKEDILKENALLNYIQDKNLPIETDSFATNHYVEDALATFSGLLLLIIILISGSELLTYETRHRTVMQGFPVSFMTKVNSKVIVYFIYIYSFLLAGSLIGLTYTASKHAGDLAFPILIYRNESYTAVSTTQYLLYMFIGFALVIILLLYVSILLNLLFKNAFANILVGLGIFSLPYLVESVGININPFIFLNYIDIESVLSGNLATIYGVDYSDFIHVFTVMIAMISITILSIYLINKYTYSRTPKDTPIERAF